MDDDRSLSDLNDAGELLTFIDDTLKQDREGAWEVCINPERGIWQSLSTIPLNVLKRIAAGCRSGGLVPREPDRRDVTHRKQRRD